MLKSVFIILFLFTMESKYREARSFYLMFFYSFLQFSKQKHLGLILDSKLSFEKHLNEKIIKAKKAIGIIKYLSKFLPLKTLDQMYKALICSHLDYCDPTPYLVTPPPLQGTPPLLDPGKYNDIYWSPGLCLLYIVTLGTT